jgi:hypothetical protein
MNTGSLSTEEFWDQYISSPADDSNPSSGYATSNKDLDEMISHTRTVLSQEPEASHDPSDENTMLYTAEGMTYKRELVFTRLQIPHPYRIIP